MSVSDERPARIHTLDAMRGLAAIAVVFFHIDFFTRLKVAPKAYLAVDFFFMLSGFVIARSYDPNLSGRRVGLKRFFLKRVIRLYPLYLCGLLAGVIEKTLQCGIQGGDAFVCRSLPRMFVLHAAMIPMPAAGGLLYPLNVPFWSLCVEIATYVAFALLSRRGTMTMLIFTPISAFFLVLGVAKYGNLNLGWTQQTMLFGYARAGVAFPIGIIIAWATRRWSSAPTPVGLLPVLLLAMLLIRADLIIPTRYTDILVVTFVFPMLIMMSAHWSIPAFMERPSVILGRMSYAMYAVHFPIVLSIFYLERKLLHGNFPEIYISVPIIIVAIAAILTFAIDEPLVSVLSSTSRCPRTADPIEWCARRSSEDRRPIEPTVPRASP